MVAADYWVPPAAPTAVVDAWVANRNIATKSDEAALVVGLGPGFTAGADVIGGVIRDVCHRPEIVAALAGTDLDSRLDPRTCASVLAHRRGGLKRVPRHARAVVAITKVAAERADAAAEIATALEAVARFDRVVLFPQRPRPPRPKRTVIPRSAPRSRRSRPAP